MQHAAANLDRDDRTWVDADRLLSVREDIDRDHRATGYSGGVHLGPPRVAETENDNVGVHVSDRRGGRVESLWGVWVELNRLAFDPRSRLCLPPTGPHIGLAVDDAQTVRTISREAEAAGASGVKPARSIAIAKFVPGGELHLAVLDREPSCRAPLPFSRGLEGATEVGAPFGRSGHATT